MNYSMRSKSTFWKLSKSQQSSLNSRISLSKRRSNTSSSSKKLRKLKINVRNCSSSSSKKKMSWKRSKTFSEIKKSLLRALRRPWERRHQY